MVFLNVELDHLPVLPLADRREDPAQFLFDTFFFQYFSPVLGCPHNVVLQVVKTM